MNIVNISFNAHLARIEGPLSPELVECISFHTVISLEEDQVDLWQSTNLPLSHIEKNHFALLRNTTNCYDFPTGLLPTILFKLKDLGYKVSLNKLINPAVRTEAEFNPKLRPAQVEFIKSALKNKRGLLEAPTSFGKSYCMGELCLQFEGPVLILVPKRALMYQMQKELQEYTGEKVGLLGDQKQKLERITVAIDDSVVNRIEQDDPEATKYFEQVSVLMVDEVHRFINPTFEKISNYFTWLEYKLGISATPWSVNENLFIGFFGPKIFEASVQETIDTGSICNPIVEFYHAPAGYAPKTLLSKELHKLPANHRYKICNQLYDYLVVNNGPRNKLAAELAKEFINREEGPLLVIVSKVGTSGGISHADIFQQLLTESYGIELPILHGNTPKSQFKKIVEQLEDYEIPGAIVSEKIFTDGVSIKSIAGMILLCAGRGGDKGRDFVQRIGRALRQKEGKGRPLIRDFIDPISYFANQSKERLNCAKSIYPEVYIVDKKGGKQIA